MQAINESIETYHRFIILSLGFVIVFMAASCIFHDLIPICHGIFGCDHNLHVTGSH
jgi:hypothetical protein